MLCCVVCSARSVSEGLPAAADDWGVYIAFDNIVYARDPETGEAWDGMHACMHVPPSHLAALH